MTLIVNLRRDAMARQPSKQVGFVPEDVPQSCLNHWIIAERKKRSRIRLKPDTRLSQCESIAEFEACAFINRAAVHDDNENVTPRYSLNILNKYLCLRLFDWHPVSHKIEYQATVFLREIDVRKRGDRIPYGPISIPLGLREQWSSEIHSRSVRVHTTPPLARISSIRFSKSNGV
jgi:hypothetical protein